MLNTSNHGCSINEWSATPMSQHHNNDGKRRIRWSAFGDCERTQRLETLVMPWWSGQNHIMEVHEIGGSVSRFRLRSLWRICPSPHFQSGPPSTRWKFCNVSAIFADVAKTRASKSFDLIAAQDFGAQKGGRRLETHRPSRSKKVCQDSAVSTTVV